MRVGSHEVDPGDEPDPDRDDEGVDQASPVATGRTAADQEQDSADEAWVDAQVQGVGDGGERKRAAEEPLVVVCDDVPGHEEQLADRDQVPGEPALGSVQPGGHDDREGGRGPNDIEDGPNPQDLGSEQVCEGEPASRGQVGDPCLSLH